MTNDSTPELLQIPSAGFPGNVDSQTEPEPCLWHQVDAFRELLQEGGQLLGEVLLFTRNAEEALAALDHEKAALDREREALREEKEKACREVSFAFEQLKAQEAELIRLRSILASAEADQHQLTQTESALSRSLQKALRETERRVEDLEEQLRQAQQPQLIHAIEQVEETTSEEATRLQSLQHELEQTRLILAGERLRRNRAISLIRPNAKKEPGV